MNPTSSSSTRHFVVIPHSFVGITTNSSSEIYVCSPNLGKEMLERIFIEQRGELDEANSIHVMTTWREFFDRLSEYGSEWTYLDRSDSRPAMFEAMVRRLVPDIPHGAPILKSPDVKDFVAEDDPSNVLWHNMGSVRNDLKQQGLNWLAENQVEFPSPVFWISIEDYNDTLGDLVETLNPVYVL